MTGNLGAAGESVGPVFIGSDQWTFSLKSNSLVGTVTLWRASGKLSSPAATDYREVETFTGDTEKTVWQGSPHFWKATIEAGDYTSGDADVRMEE